MFPKCFRFKKFPHSGNQNGRRGGVDNLKYLNHSFCFNYFSWVDFWIVVRIVRTIQNTMQGRWAVKTNSCQTFKMIVTTCPTIAAQINFQLICKQRYEWTYYCYYLFIVSRVWFDTNLSHLQTYVSSVNKLMKRTLEFIHFQMCTYAVLLSRFSGM